MRLDRTVNKSRSVALVALLGGLVLAGCNRQAPPPARPAPEVSTVTIQPQKIMLTTELPGRTSAYRIAEIRPQVNGLILKRLFTEGSDVKAGQVLYQIDPAPFQAALDNARAALGRAEANLPAIRSRAERFKELLADKAVSQQDYDDAAAALKQIEADIAVLEGAGGDGPHQSGIHQGHRAHLRAHRQVQRDGRRHRDGLSTHGAGDHSADWIPFMWMCPNPPPNCCA